MFCRNCGSQIPDGTKFCSNCGTAQESVNTVENNQVQQTTDIEKSGKDSEKPKMKKIVISLAVVAVAFVLGRAVIAPAMLSDGNTEPSGGNEFSGGVDEPDIDEPDIDEPDVDATSNPEYDKIFSERYMVPGMTFLLSPNQESYAKVDHDENTGMECITKVDIGYRDRMIEEMVETYYLLLDGFTEQQVQAMTASFKSSFAKYESINCCTVTDEQRDKYYKVEVKYSEMNSSSNIAELYSKGIITANTPISFENHEKQLLSAGYVKK